MESSETSPHSEPTGKVLEPGSNTAGRPGEVSGFFHRKPVHAPWWVRVVPFFLSAFFFLSAVFAIFAPLPLLFLRFRSGRLWTWIAIATNSAIVAFSAGRLSLSVYAVFVAVLALVMGELVASRRTIEKTVLVTLTSMGLCGAVLIGWYAHIHHVNPLVEFRQELGATVDYLQQSVAQNGGTALSEADLDDWKQSLLVEFPSAIAVFALILVWANLATLLRLNPGGVRERMGLDAGFWRNWRAPEWLVWPTIVAGIFLIVDAGRISEASINVFRFLMAVYAIQGMSILSFFFDVWHVRGILRALGFILSVLLMMPLLLSLGFFDLWFDFRSKFRQV